MEKLQNSGLKQTKPEKRFFFREENKSFLVYDILNSEIFMINKTTKEFLDLLELNLPSKEIISIISKKYNLPKEKISKDLKLIVDCFK